MGNQILANLASSRDQDLIGGGLSVRHCNYDDEQDKNHQSGAPCDNSPLIHAGPVYAHGESGASVAASVFRSGGSQELRHFKFGSKVRRSHEAPSQGFAQPLVRRANTPYSLNY